MIIVFVINASKTGTLQDGNGAGPSGSAEPLFAE